MKKIYTAFLLLPFVCFGSIFPGNGNTGFGGVAGPGSLNVTDNGSNINFSFTKGPSSFNDILVIYIDNLQSGGLTSTSGLLDDGDQLRSATSGYNSSNKTTINFPAGFTPSYAIAVGPSVSFAGLFHLVNGGTYSLGYVNSANLSTNTTTDPVFNFNIAASDIGGSVSFRFIATYISSSAYLSDEAIGFAITPGNPGFGSTINPTTYDTYVSTLPLTLLQFNGTIQGNNSVLSWRTTSESNIRNFVIEQSADGKHWSDLITRAATNTSRTVDYTATTPNTASLTYYRLKINELSGEISYSNIVALKSHNNNAVTLLGNMITNEIRFVVKNDVAEVNAYLYSSDGKLVQSQQLKGKGAGAVYTINSNLQGHGMHILKVVVGKENISSFKIFQSK